MNLCCLVKTYSEKILSKLSFIFSGQDTINNNLKSTNDKLDTILNELKKSSKHFSM